MAAWASPGILPVATIFYDSFTKAVGGPLQAAVSALPWTEALQFPGPGLNFADPYDGQAQPFASQTFVKPAAILTVDQLMRPPYAKLELVD